MGDDDWARVMAIPLPASLPDIGPVMALDEALCWLAHDKPSYDIEVYQNAAGDLAFIGPNGMQITSALEGADSIDRLRTASRNLYVALRDGSLIGYISPENGGTLTVPRLYWNRVHPENLSAIYRGTSLSNIGVGCPILLARIAFDAWRISLPVVRIPETPRPSHDEVVDWCERWIGAGNGNGMDKAWPDFKIDPKHKGLSRDLVFRPAWNHAKGKKNRGLDPREASRRVTRQGY